MQRQLSKNIRIASLVMGLTLSAMVSAKNLLCLTLDGTGANDAIAILSINKLGDARGALCYMDLASTTTLEKCHVVTGTATGKNPVRIGVQGVDLADGHGGTLGAKSTPQPLSAGFSGTQLQSTQGAFTYTRTPGSTESSGSVGAPDAGTGVVTSSADPEGDPLVYSASPRSVAAPAPPTVVVTDSVSGPVTAVRCTANKLKASRDVQIMTKTPEIGTYIAPAGGVVDGILFP
jgi:hypothetical protein